MRSRHRSLRRAADRSIAEAQRAPRGVFVDYSKPVPIPYVCERCKARRARMVELRKVVHANYESPKLCPVCKPEESPDARSP
jgi:hypothetical protein